MGWMGTGVRGWRKVGWRRWRRKKEPGRGSAASSKVCRPRLPAARSRRRASSPPSPSAASRLPSGSAPPRGGLWAGWGRGGAGRAQSLRAGGDNPARSSGLRRLGRARSGSAAPAPRLLPPALGQEPQRHVDGSPRAPARAGCV